MAFKKKSGTAKGETLNGTTGADWLLGLGGNDTLRGGRGNDKLDGGTGNGKLDGGAGNDILIGGRGSDTAIFASASTANTITLASGGLFVSGAQGADFVKSGVEFLKFTDGTFSFAQLQAIAAGPQPGSPLSFTLTTGVDTLTGGTANDTFAGSMNTDIPVLSTFFAGDSLDGGAGTGDLVKFTIAGTPGLTFNGTQLANIETAEFTNTVQGPTVTINTGLWTGVTKIASVASDPLSFTKLTNIATITAAELRNGSGQLDLD